MATSQSDRSTSAFDTLISSPSVATSPAEISHSNQRWVKFDQPENRKKGSKVSVVWSLGQTYISVNDASKKAWRCNACGAIIQLVGDNSSNAAKHLQAKHSIQVSEKVTAVLASRQGSIVHSMNIPAFRRELLQWIVTRQHSFIEVEDPHFQGMLLALNQSVEAYLVNCGDTIKNWLQEEFVKASACVKELLLTSQSRINISMDLWTSPNGYALCGIVAHFIDADLMNRQCLLSLKRMESSHSGEEITKVMVPVLCEFNVLDNLGVFVSDNADQNDHAVKAIIGDFLPGVDWVSRRGRCLGHIINLAAKAFLFGKGSDVFDTVADLDEEDVEVKETIIERAQMEWRKQGPIGKLHNLVVAIRKTPQRREAFQVCQVGNPKIDGMSKC